MKNLIIIGAGGHGRVAYDIAKNNGYNHISFLDDKEIGNNIIGKTDDFVNFADSSVFFVAIGNNEIRKSVSEKLTAKNAEIVSLVHSSAIVLESVSIGKGTIIMPGVIVNANTKIGEGCILNTGSSADHDNTIGDFCHISPKACLCGTVKLGNNVWICAGAIIINNISICDNTIIGAGVVVKKNISNQGIYK
ncbi:MAG: acetyltransferase, partial [Armatimonadetes bacterium]|nr:acetyltransferase [Candidatus Hippobium faecium]